MVSITLLADQGSEEMQIRPTVVYERTTVTLNSRGDMNDETQTLQDYL